MYLFEAFKETANEIFPALCHFVLTIQRTVKPYWYKDKVNSEQYLEFLKNYVVNVAEMKSERFCNVLTYYAFFPKIVFVFSITHIHLNGDQREPNLRYISVADANIRRAKYYAILVSCFLSELEWLLLGLMLRTLVHCAV